MNGNQMKEAWHEDSGMLRHFVFLCGCNGNNDSGAEFKSTADGSSAKNGGSESYFSSSHFFS
jgi:hypothetical protein